VGHIGRGGRAQDAILDGLRRLEYRGYDSAGIAILHEGKIRIVRAVGKLLNLEASLRDVPLRGDVGIGHTRWATHGRPSETNAHPHCAGSIAVIHNGIVENYRALRDELLAQGRTLRSETDTEVIAHLIAGGRASGKPLVRAVREALDRLEGSYALAILDESEPDRIVAAKNGGSPLILGAGEGEQLVASDIPAILPYTRRVIPLEDGDVAVLTRGGFEIFDARGRPVERQLREVRWDPVQAEKGGYDHFMEKEIHEQPRAVADTIGSRVLEDEGDVLLDEIDLDAEWVRGLSAVHLVACGTAWHAALLGAWMIERFARVRAAAEFASEFRYRDPVVGSSDLVLPVSQSGETADTLAALREGKRRGARSLALTNTRDSTIARESDHALYTHAGLEIGVASTKCFTTQIVALHLLALKLGLMRQALSNEEVRKHIAALRRLPRQMEQTLRTWEHVAGIARRHFHADDWLFLGRGVGFPIALEGALKLKELSYIHAEGYAAAEMKHGPIALIDDDFPVVIVANQRATHAKILANAAEVRARGATVIAVAELGDEEVLASANEVIGIPAVPDPLSAILAALPLQMLAYHVATLRGTDVDQPRNLAKSVTVE
jgi:glucosamine--fructose-6-phosphate aminotransferase (isomerizing)